MTVRRLTHAGYASTGAGAPSGTPNYSPASHLTIPTYTGVGECLEPDVLFFPAKWNGHRYWMAMVPIGHTDIDASNENPSIVVSENGTDWVVPVGLTNPVSPKGTNQFNADPMLCMSADGLTMYLYWIVSDTVTAANRGVYVRSSTDGVTWSAASQTLQDTAGTLVEPKVLYDPVAGNFRLYTLNGTGAKPFPITYRTASTPTGTWSAPVTCTGLAPPGLSGDATANSVWHYSILREPNGRWVMSFCDTSNGNNQGGKAWLASSWDGAAWTVASRSFAGTVSWMPTGPYRPCIQQISSGVYGVWISTQSNGSGNFVGYAALPASEIPAP